MLEVSFWVKYSLVHWCSDKHRLGKEMLSWVGVASPVNSDFSNLAVRSKATTSKDWGWQRSNFTHIDLKNNVLLRIFLSTSKRAQLKRYFTPSNKQNWDVSHLNSDCKRSLQSELLPQLFRTCLAYQRLWVENTHLKPAESQKNLWREHSALLRSTDWMCPHPAWIRLHCRQPSSWMAS